MTPGSWGGVWVEKFRVINNSDAGRSVDLNIVINYVVVHFSEIFHRTPLLVGRYILF